MSYERDVQENLDTFKIGGASQKIADISGSPEKLKQHIKMDIELIPKSTPMEKL